LLPAAIRASLSIPSSDERSITAKAFFISFGHLSIYLR
jgi:hypothetical protein